MSSASTTRTIKFMSKAGTYMAIIMCPDGDLFQYWDGTGADQTVFPNFESTQPKLNFVCTSSRVAEGIASVGTLACYFNDIEIAFNASGYSTGVFCTGTPGASGSYFKKYAADTNNPYPGLQILKNIAALSNYAPATIKMTGTVSYQTQTDAITASYTIPIQQKTPYVGKVTIEAGDDKCFVISSKGDSCILRAKAYGEVNGAMAALSVGLTYRWEQFNPSATGNVDGWVKLADFTQAEATASGCALGTSTLTVQESQIDTYGEFRLTVKRDGDFYGMDVQGVVDKSDPYDIEPRPEPADETIVEGDNTRDHVTYTPILVTRGGAPVSPNPLYYFLVRDGAGNVLNKWRDGYEAVNSSDPMELSTNSMASYTVTEAQCLQAGGDVSITIQAAD